VKIILYQIIHELDHKYLAFRSLREVMAASLGTVPAELYESVFNGEVDAKHLEEVYAIFNIAHPDGFRGRSLSVSDVVRVDCFPDGYKFYFCDIFGFQEIKFDAEKAMLPICNHTYECIFEERDNVTVSFIGPNGFESHACDKMILRNCRYSQCQLGFEIQFWPVGGESTQSRQFLERPDLVVTKGWIQFPGSLLYEHVEIGVQKLKHPAHSKENLRLIREWLEQQRQRFETL
jgi:hypothetical protein